MPDGDSFLPRIESVFYAVFDVQQGPKIEFQVPEGLIAAPGPLSPTPASLPPSRTSSSSLVSPTHPRPPARHSPHKRSTSSHRTLFNFDDISKYVIPPSQLCGRLVTCATHHHRVIGVPVELRGKYMRNYFRYNICFVFDRAADLSCYEPIVRKVSRVLTSCEKESCFLSNPDTSPAVHAILEQLYEDLNSYSETSIPIDRFNSIELKIFPFYPNPPPVKDWMVPLALINITKRMEDNWDLTMVKVCKYIDGTNHVSRIAHLADCDIALTRQAISHLIFYQVIMTIDIFQYSNMYTLRKSIQWLADEMHVRDECGPYVTRPGRPIPNWPKLLHLYSRLKPGKTVLEWMAAHDVHKLGIDIRRFTSFGVIKGFLRRVHRWPVLLPPDPSQLTTTQHDPSPSAINAAPSSLPRKRGDIIPGPPLRFPPYTPSPPLPDVPVQSISPERHPLPTTPQDNKIAFLPSSSSITTVTVTHQHRARRASAAEKVLEQLRSRDLQKAGGGAASAAAASPRTSWIHYQQKGGDKDKDEPGASTPTPPSTLPHSHPPHDAPTPRQPATGLSSRRPSLITPLGPPPPSPSVRPRPTWSPSAPSTVVQRGQGQSHSQALSIAQSQSQGALFPPELLGLLDGEHHEDELAVRFEVGWPLLEEWLCAAGGETGDGRGGSGCLEDGSVGFGKVCIIYR